MVRTPICNWSEETIVLAHLSGGGMGGKMPDSCAAWCCSNCHSLLDGRDHFGQAWKADQLRLWHLEGVVRTLVQLEYMGVMLREAE